MAVIDAGGGHGGKRAANHELPLIPFIDFLMCLIAFLLVTAVWSEMARVDADARVPGPADGPASPRHEKELHVEMRGNSKFELVWMEGNTVIESVDVERKAVPAAGGDVTYPELARRIAEEWKAKGAHRAASDAKFDLAVLHADNSVPFADLVAVMDAIYSPKRAFSGSGRTEAVPAFKLTFAVN